MKRNAPFATSVVLMALVSACGLLDDDEPPDGGTGGEVLACVDIWTESLEQNACPYPMATMFTGHFDGDTVLWVDDPANSTSIGPNGWLFGNTASADWLGYIVEGDVNCGVACVVPQGHPCFTDGNDFCVGGLDDDQNPGCLYCGESSAAECESFVMNACSGDPGPSTGGAADSTGGGGGADSTGDGFGASADSPPDVSMFTNHPDQLFGTTQFVLDALGPHAPPNLVAQNVCDVWDPSGAVGEWFGEPIIDKEALTEIIDQAETLLGFCDGLSLSMTTQGIQLRGVTEGTLASELGFQEGDLLESLNGVSATDGGALMAEAVSVSQQQVGVAAIAYRRNGASLSQTIWVQ